MNSYLFRSLFFRNVYCSRQIPNEAYHLDYNLIESALSEVLLYLHEKRKDTSASTPAPALPKVKYFLRQKGQALYIPYGLLKVPGSVCL